MDPGEARRLVEEAAERKKREDALSAQKEYGNHVGGAVKAQKNIRKQISRKDDEASSRPKLTLLVLLIFLLAVVLAVVIFRGDEEEEFVTANRVDTERANLKNARSFAQMLIRTAGSRNPPARRFLPESLGLDEKQSILEALDTMSDRKLLALEPKSKADKKFTAHCRFSGGGGKIHLELTPEKSFLITEVTVY